MTRWDKRKTIETDTPVGPVGKDRAVINEIALVVVGTLIGALVYFVIGWVTIERSVQELTQEARTMRGENEELRALLRDLAALVESARDGQQRDGVALARPAGMASLDESIYSVAVERELEGGLRAQALVGSGYRRGS